MTSKRLRFLILRRDNYTCRYCGRKAPDVALEVDHVVPRSRGGRDNANNLVTACYDCNRGKGAMAAVLKRPERPLRLPESRGVGGLVPIRDVLVTIYNALDERAA